MIRGHIIFSLTQRSLSPSLGTLVVIRGNFTRYMISLVAVLFVLHRISPSWSSREMDGWRMGLGSEHKKRLPLSTALPPLTHVWEAHPAARGHIVGLKASHLTMN